MYPVKLGFNEALARISKLVDNGHHAEALVTSVFTLEKLVRRSLRLAIVLRGFTSKQAETLIGKKGFSELKEFWAVFDRHNRPLNDIIGNKIWQNIPEAITRRNRLVHGERVYSLSECRVYADHVVCALKLLQQEITKSYGRDPWATLPGRKKTLLGWHEQKTITQGDGKEMLHG